MITFGGQEDSSFVEANIGAEGTFNVVLEKWGNESIEKLRKSLRDKTSTGTSKQLEQSLIALPIQVGSGTFLLTLKGEDYYKYIDKGVQGAGGQRSEGQWTNKAPQSQFKFSTKKPPVNFSSLSGASLRQWAFNKGLNEYAVRESIFRQGIKATNFYSDIMNEKWIGELVSRLEKSGAKEIELVISKEYGNNS
jgi:hypothetical protein